MAARISIGLLSYLASISPVQAQCEVESWEGATPFDHGFFGDACSIDGDFAVVGSPGVAQGKGRAFLFRRGLYGWTQVHLSGPGGGSSGDVRYGEAVDIEEQDAIIGAPDTDFSTGDAFFLRWNGTGWNQTHIEPEAPIRGSKFGYSVSMDGDKAAIGAPFSSDGGAVYVFHREGNDWVQEA